MANQNEQKNRPAMDQEKPQSGNKDQKNQQKPDQQKPGNNPLKNQNPGQQSGRS